MLNLESTSSRMSHLARQELYEDRSTDLDAMLSAIEGVSSDLVRDLSRQLFGSQPLGLTVLGDVDGLKVAREQLAIA
jgi:predicted Zn-dependent peptidase